MKESLFQRLFDRKSHEAQPRSRRLSLESLENRELLNVDWGGFNPENTCSYTPEASSQYNIDLPQDYDCMKLVNLEGDAKDELVVIYGKGKTVSVYECDSNGDFQLKKEQTISTLGNWGLYSSSVFADFNNDGYEEMMLVTSNGLALNASIYAWNSASAAFEESVSYSLDSTPYLTSVGSDSRYVFVEISPALLNDASGSYDLVLQVQTLTLSGSTYATAVYSNVGASSFGTNPVAKSAVTGALIGSTNINGESYLIVKEASNTTNLIVLQQLGASTSTKTYYDFTAYGKFVYSWVDAKDGFIVVGGILGGTGKSGFATLNLTEKPVDNTTVDASTLGTWTASDNLTVSSASVGALGDFGGDSDYEILIGNTDEHSSVFFIGDASTSYGYVFQASDLYVNSTDYVSVYVGDYDSDNKKEAVLVGSNYVYVSEVDDNGNFSAPTKAYKFSMPVKKAVFGDFDADGLMDIAVQFRANIGSSVLMLRQSWTGEFYAYASQVVPGTFVDITTGRFTQSDRDEIAVVYSQYKNSATATTVQTYRLNIDEKALTACYSTTYVGDGVSITAGDLYGAGRDDLVVVSSSENNVSVLRNTGSSLLATTLSTQYDGTSVAQPTSAAIGDFNGDGLNDLAVMNSSAGTNAAEVVYYLRSASTGLASKPSGRVRINKTVTTADNSVILGALQAADLNNDGFDDLAFVRQSTDGVAYVSALMGNGSSAVFDSVANATVSLDPTVKYGVTLARVDSGNSSYDFVWAQGKNIGTLLNSNEASASAGSVRYVLQSKSSDSGDSLDDAIASQRTWLDEWSNFYVDVWANTNGSDSVTSVSGTFAFNDEYFTVAAVEPADGYTVTSSVADDSVSYVATGTGAADANGWTLVARISFQPVENGGLALAENGKLYYVDPGFSASVSSQTVNGISVENATAPTGVELFPYAFDLNDNGQVDLEDFTLIVSYYPANALTDIPVAKHRVLDVNGNTKFDLEDFTLAVAAFSLRSTSGKDSAYQTHPVISTASAAPLNTQAVLDVALTAASFDSDDDDWLEDAVEVLAEELVPAGPAPRVVEQDFDGAQELETIDPVAFGPEFQGKELEIDLDVELALEL